METSLFTLSKNSYVPSVGRNPAEDYLTQAFAWMLREIDDLALYITQQIMQKMQNPFRNPITAILLWRLFFQK